VHGATNLKVGVTSNLRGKRAEKNLRYCTQNCRMPCVFQAICIGCCRV